MHRLFYLLIFCLLLHPLSLGAEMAPPLPPLENPHPPLTEQDKKRVLFATEATKLFWMSSKTLSPTNTSEKSDSFQNKDLACLKSEACYRKDKMFLAELQNFQKRFGTIEEIKHAHIIPWSMLHFKRMNSPSAPIRDQEATKPMEGPSLQDDEYIVHIYTKNKPSNSYPQWHHLNVILSEDKDGNIYLRHFFIIKMSNPKLPAGAIC